MRQSRCVYRVVVFMGAALSICGCSLQAVEGESASDGSILVTVSIPPHAFLVERVGGKQVDVDVLGRQGQSPATYEITGRQMSSLGLSEIYFLSGVPFEKPLMAKIKKSFPNLRFASLPPPEKHASRKTVIRLLPS